MPNDLFSEIAKLPPWVYGCGGAIAAGVAPFAKEIIKALIERWKESERQREAGQQAVTVAEINAAATVRVAQESEETDRIGQLLAANAELQKYIETLHGQIEVMVERKAQTELDCERRLNAVHLELLAVKHQLDRTRAGLTEFMVDEFERQRNKDD